MDIEKCEYYYSTTCKMCNSTSCLMAEELNKLQEENKRLDFLLGKLNEELLKIVEPRMLSDFTGYNEETNSFDIVLAVKEIIEELEHEVERLEDKCCECERE